MHVFLEVWWPKADGSAPSEASPDWRRMEGLRVSGTGPSVVYSPVGMFASFASELHFSICICFLICCNPKSFSADLLPITPRLVFVFLVVPQ